MKTKWNYFPLLLLLTGVLCSFAVVEPEITVKDKSGNTYKICTIGKQQWLQSNLNTSRFRNGDIIPQAKNRAEWESGGAHWCYYKFDPKNGVKYGKLYNWSAIDDSRGLAPEGWHIPSQEEWQALIDTLGGDSVAVMKMKSKTGWMISRNDSVLVGINGNNESGFNALPAGEVMDVAAFNGINQMCKWATSTVKSPFIVAFWLNGSSQEHSFSTELRDAGFYVRCVRDPE